MKSYPMLVGFILTTFIFSSCSKPSNIISLDEGWKFLTGDNTEYSKPGFDDSSWKNIKIGAVWEGQGYKDYNGIAWYRMHIRIPSFLKNAGIKQLVDELELKLGKIDDNDICFINGVEIGRTKGYSLDRCYFISNDKINWDKENLIAIRVEDTGGGGGLYQGPCLLKKPVISDVLTISNSAILQIIGESTDTIINSTVHFNFSYPIKKVEGKMKVELENTYTKENTELKNENIIIGTHADSIYNFKVAVAKEGIYKIHYAFISSLGKDRLQSSCLVAYKKIKHEKESPVSELVEKKISDNCTAFPYGQVKLEGYLEERLQKNLENRLLNIDENGILECFYNRPGKQEWVGEYAGKYLHAASRVWLYSQDPRLKSQMDRIADILISCQDTDGYLGTYLPQDKWTSWDVWAHKYDLLGLLSYYRATGYKPALETCRKIGDLLCRTFGTKKGQRDLVKAGYHVGMAPCSVLEPMTELYRFTGEKKFLDFCNYIIEDYESEAGPKIISTLTGIGKVDKAANGKAYEMTSNLVGIVKLYQLTGEPKLLQAAEAAWEDIAKYKLYITGTASAGEMFREDFDLPADNNAHMGEGCVTVTWLQLSQVLYYLTGEEKYMDEIEKTIYNHLLAAENPTSGCVSYYTALIGKKPFRCSIDGNCCLASVPRGIAIIPELVYSRLQEGGLSINIYSAGKISGKIKNEEGSETNLTASIETNYPSSGKIKLRLMPSHDSKFKLKLRIPAWCKSFAAIIDGKEYKAESGRYLEIDKEWGTHNTIDISFDLNPHILAGGKSYPGYQALQIGPQVLAFDQQLNPGIINPDNILSAKMELISGSVNRHFPINWVGSESYKIKVSYNNKSTELLLVPFADAGQTDGEVRVWLKK